MKNLIREKNTIILLNRQFTIDLNLLKIIIFEEYNSLRVFLINLV